MQIVHTDNRRITADCDSGKRQTRPLLREGPTSRSLQLPYSNINLVLSPTWVLYSETDWPTDRR
jgi:hypothetical protein